MIDYKDLFNLDNEEIQYIDDDNVVDQSPEGYTLCQYDGRNSGFKYFYKVYNPFDEVVAQWDSNVDALNMNMNKYNSSSVKIIFKNAVENAMGKVKTKINKYNKQISLFDTDDEDDTSSYYKNYYKWTPPAKETGFLDKLNKSDTLVIHCEDRSTDMLSQVYEGKGWDVLRNGNIDKEELHQLLENHDRLIFLGHGTPSGLINKQGGGYVIDSDDASYLKNKKIFAIWCYAATYFKKNGLTGQGILCSDNAPSEVWECSAACGAHVSASWILENITYWSKCMADVCEMALNGNPKNACELAKENYYKSYEDCTTEDERKVVDFNTNTIQVV